MALASWRMSDGMIREELVQLVENIADEHVMYDDGTYDPDYKDIERWTRRHEELTAELAEREQAADMFWTREDEACDRARGC